LRLWFMVVSLAKLKGYRFAPRPDRLELGWTNDRRCGGIGHTD